MLGSPRNFVFRVSIVINIAVLLYAAMHLSGRPGPASEWVPVTGDGVEPEPVHADFRYLNEQRREEAHEEAREEARNETDAIVIAQFFEEMTSQKTPSTAAPTKRTASSTASVAVPSVSHPSSVAALHIVDENTLSVPTLARLRALLACTERDFYPQTAQRGEFWVLRNYVRADHGSLLCHETVTYTTHAGFEFLDNVLPLVQRWMAPVSLAIHAPGSDLAPTVDSIRYLRDCTGSKLIKSLVTFHVFFSHKHIPNKIPDPASFLHKRYNCSVKPPYVVKASSTYMKQKGLLYPVNVARNIARDAALTHFILPSDIELYPSPLLVPRFLNMIARNEKPLSTSTAPRVFPISIFEVDARVKVPSTKTELQAMLKNKTAIPFHKFVCPNCHNIPQAQQWISAKETAQMEVFHVGKRKGKYVIWEPIFIGTHRDPYYDERLSWEGKKDKMTQGYILCVKDYEFMILNNAFLTHKPGIKHFAKNPKRDAIVARQNHFVKGVITPELKKLFGTRDGCAM